MIDDDEEPLALSMGMVCDVLSSKLWVGAIRRVMRRVRELCGGHTSPMFNVNVVFHVPAKDFTPDFEGLRSGRFSRKNRELMVQVAIPEGDPKGDPDEEVRRLLLEAIDLAEDFARLEAVIGPSERLDELRSIVAAI